MSILTSDQIFHNCLLALYLIGPPTYISLQFLSAPYGKHSRPGWGPTIPAPVAWFLMESPSVWFPIALFPFGRNSSNPKALILMSPFFVHYFHRTCIYPLRLYLQSSPAAAGKPGFPVSMAVLAFGFNLLNSYLQARWVSHYKVDYEADGLLFWAKFGLGLAVFVWGMRINVWADRVLLGLKKQGGGYKVPRGGWFELVSCPNYFGEILEWVGWTVMTWSWVGLGFLLYTCANLVPRARANHKWYLEKFGKDYPKSRKAVFPYLY
ncbi:Steroid 5-alpha-reductase DET2 [Linum perenne]